MVRTEPGKLATIRAGSIPDMKAKNLKLTVLVSPSFPMPALLFFSGEG